MIRPLSRPLLLCAMAFTACAPFAADSQLPPRGYAIGPAGGGVTRPVEVPAIFVASLAVDPALDGAELVWQRGVELGDYPNHQWRRPPASGLRLLVVEALREAGLTAAALPEPADPRYTLRLHLVGCHTLVEDDRWSGRVAFDYALIRAEDGVELTRGRLEAVEPAPQRNPLGSVQALQAASEALAAELAAAVRAALPADDDESDSAS